MCRFISFYSGRSSGFMRIIFWAHGGPLTLKIHFPSHDCCLDLANWNSFLDSSLSAAVMSYCIEMSQRGLGQSLSA